jgi:putative glutamine amidotransferase
MKRPLIALTATCQPNGPDSVLMGVNDAYQEAVYEAGGLPVCLPPLADLAAVSALNSEFAGFLLTGGPDLPGEYYNRADHPAMRPLHPRRAAWDMALAHFLLKDSRKPVLGICLGCQELNVAAGGDLHQHLPEVSENILVHTRAEGAPETMHHVMVEEGTLLASIVGAGKLLVNSSHHQAIDKLAPGYRATAYCQDGVIEAIEQEKPALETRFLLAVQWHPERIRHLEQQRKIFSAFIDACRQQLF